MASTRSVRPCMNIGEYSILPQRFVSRKYSTNDIETVLPRWVFLKGKMKLYTEQQEWPTSWTLFLSAKTLKEDPENVFYTLLYSPHNIQSGSLARKKIMWSWAVTRTRIKTILRRVSTAFLPFSYFLPSTAAFSRKVKRNPNSRKLSFQLDIET